MRELPLKVLVVDDAEDTRELLAESLRSFGFSTEEAANGREALDRARAWLPDVIVMDLNMPVMDGLVATQTLRHDPNLGGIPVLLVTGSGVDDLSKKARVAGVNVVLAKPCSPDVVRSTINRVVGAA